MSQHMPRTPGLDVLRDMPWGPHACHFYDDPHDLLEAIVPFVASGVTRGEACVVLVAELTPEETRCALGRELPDVDGRVEDGTLAIVPAEDWYRRAGGGLAGVCDAWSARLAEALAGGWRGLRVTGTTSWVPAAEWRDFCAYEHTLDRALGERPMQALCSYPAGACGPMEVLEACAAHGVALARRDGVWEAVRSGRAAAGPSEVVPEGEWRRRERDNIIAALRRSGGRVYGAGGAAELLDLKPSTLQSRMRALKLRAADVVT